MQLGSLSTVAARGAKNLCIVIMDNGAYQITGGQVTMTAQGADIVGIARASGLAQSAWAADEDAFVELIGRPEGRRPVADRMPDRSGQAGRYDRT